jgi:hypothetical protein
MRRTPYGFGYLKTAIYSVGDQIVPLSVPEASPIPVVSLLPTHEG